MEASSDLVPFLATDSLPFNKIENGAVTPVFLPKNGSTLEAFMTHYTPTEFDLPEEMKANKATTLKVIALEEFFKLPNCYSLLEDYEDGFCPRKLSLAKVSEDSAILSKVGEQMIINNFKQIQTTVQHAFDEMNSLCVGKAKVHVNVEGFVRTGKSTLSTFVIPFLYTQLMTSSKKEKHASFKHYRTIVFDVLTMDGDNIYEFIYGRINNAFPFIFNDRDDPEARIKDALAALHNYGL